jgi:hypothetical protein
VLLDRSHIRWALGSGVVTLACGLHFARYSRLAPGGPSGGSVEGLWYGVAAFLAILFAALLSLRRKVPSWRIGSAQLWLKAHIWVSLVSVPLLLFHCGFRFGGTMATLLVVLFSVIIASGIFGLVLQQFLPQRMMLQCSMEAVYERIERLLDDLREEARLRIENKVGPLPLESLAPAPGGASPGLELKPGEGPLVEFYLRHVRPFLDGEPSNLAADRPGAGPFGAVRNLIAPELHATVDELDSICEERRQLLLELRLHHLLHGWLFVHVPLSMLLVALMCVHAVQALKF